MAGACLVAAGEKAIFDDRALRQPLYADESIIAHILDAVLGKFDGGLIEQCRSATATQQRVIDDFVGRAAIGGDWKLRIGNAIAMHPDAARRHHADAEARFACAVSLSMRFSSTSPA